MKNAVLKVWSSRVAIVFSLMMGLFLFAPDTAQAQNFANAATEYVSAPIAISRLEIETVALKSQLENLIPGTFAYKTALWKYELFDVVLNELYRGETVQNSVQVGLKLYSTDVYDDMPDSMKKANRIELNLILQS